MKKCSDMKYISRRYENSNQILLNNFICMHAVECSVWATIIDVRNARIHYGYFQLKTILFQRFGPTEV